MHDVMQRVSKATHLPIKQPSQQVVVRLPAETALFLERETLRLGDTLSGVIRKAIEQYQHAVETTPKKGEKNPLLEAAHHAEELYKKHKHRIKNRPTDLSTNYKKYLYGEDFR